MTWLPVAVFSLLNGLAFLVQATPAVQRLMAPTIPVASLDQVITYGLASATLASAQTPLTDHPVIGYNTSPPADPVH